MPRGGVIGTMTGTAVMLCCWGATVAADGAILTVSGQIEASPEGAPVVLGREDLEALPQHRLRTSTSVTDGVPEFEGFLMRDLMELVGAEGETAIALALNGYRIEIPVADFERFDVMGALSMNGEQLTPRDKGPIWIVYPRDAHRELDDIRYDMRWVWQLERLHVR